MPEKTEHSAFIMLSLVAIVAIVALVVLITGRVSLNTIPVQMQIADQNQEDLSSSAIRFSTAPMLTHDAIFSPLFIPVIPGGKNYCKDKNGNPYIYGKGKSWTNKPFGYINKNWEASAETAKLSAYLEASIGLEKELNKHAIEWGTEADTSCNKKQCLALKTGTTISDMIPCTLDLLELPIPLGIWLKYKEISTKDKCDFKFVKIIENGGSPPMYKAAIKLDHSFIITLNGFYCYK